MKRLRLVKICAVLMCAALTVLLLAAWLTFQHVPGWYHPRWLTRAEIQRVQREVDASFDQITRRLADGEPVSISVTSGQLNDLLAARAHLWPAADSWPSPALSGPCVLLEEHNMRLGLRHHWGEVQSIWSARLTPVISEDFIDLALDQLRAGSLPVPRALWPGGAAPEAGAGSGAPGRELTGMRTSRLGVRVPNRFEWPSGRIPFSITDLELTAEGVTIRVRPERFRHE